MGEYDSLLFLVVMLYGVLPLVALLLVIWMVGCCVRGRAVTCWWCCMSDTRGGRVLCTPSRKPTLLRVFCGALTMSVACLCFAALFKPWAHAYTDMDHNDLNTTPWQWRKMNLYALMGSDEFTVRLKLTHFDLEHRWGEQLVSYSYDMERRVDVADWPCPEYGSPVKSSLDDQACVYVGDVGSNCEETCDLYGLPYNDWTETLLWENECNRTEWSLSQRTCSQFVQGINAYSRIPYLPTPLDPPVTLGCHVSPAEQGNDLQAHYGRDPCDADRSVMRTFKKEDEYRVCVCAQPWERAQESYDLCAHPAATNAPACTLNETHCGRAGKWTMALTALTVAATLLSLAVLWTDTRRSGAAVDGWDLPPRLRFAWLSALSCALMVTSLVVWEAGCSTDELPYRSALNLRVSGGWTLTMIALGLECIVAITWVLTVKNACQPSTDSVSASEHTSALDSATREELGLLRARVAELEQQSEVPYEGEQSSGYFQDTAEVPKQ